MQLCKEIISNLKTFFQVVPIVNLLSFSNRNNCIPLGNIPQAKRAANTLEDVIIRPRIIKTLALYFAA